MFRKRLHFVPVLTLIACLNIFSASCFAGQLTSKSRPSSTVTALREGFSINGNELQPNVALSVAPGVTTINFDGNSVLTEIRGKRVKKDHQNVKTIACIALLPLCPAIMSINTDQQAKVVTEYVSCIGSTVLDLGPNEHYVTELLEREVTYPIMQVREIDAKEAGTIRGSITCTES